MVAKRKEGRICQECLHTIYETDDLNYVLTESWSSHYIIMCDDCIKKTKTKQKLVTPFNKYKPKKNFIEGSPTKTGTKRFFFKRNGKVILLTAESGIKKDLKPAKKNEIK